MAAQTEGEPARRLDRSLSTHESDSVTLSAFDSEHGSGLLKRMEALREEERYCDVVLITSKKNKIHAHRLVLSAFSKYFEKLLGPNFIDGKQKEIPLLYPEDKVLESLINFAYSGKADINVENVYDLLDGARFLGVEFVVKACADFLTSAIDDVVCIDVFQIADRFYLKEPRDVALKHILRHFVKVCLEGEAFLELPSELFMDIIQQQGICVAYEGLVPSVEQREEAVLQVLLRYVKHDLESRRGKFAEFLSHVRVGLISSSYLEEARAECLQSELPECAEAIGTVIANKVAKSSSKTDATANNDKMAKPREFANCQVWRGRVYAGGRQISSEIENFDDEHLVQNDDVYVKGMKIWIRRWDGRPVVGGVQVHYSNGKSVMHGGSSAEECYEFNLGNNERIVALDINSGWMIDRLTFYTNKGEKGQRKTYGPYGGPGGGEHSETPPGSFGFLSWIKGAVVETQGSLGITRLQFQWRSFFFPEDENAAVDSDNSYHMDSDTGSFSEGWSTESD